MIRFFDPTADIVPLIVSVMFAASIVLMAQAAMGLLREAKAGATMNRRLRIDRDDEPVAIGDMMIEVRRERGLNAEGGFALPVEWFNKLITRSGLTFKPALWFASAWGAGLLVFGIAVWKMDSLFMAAAMGLVTCAFGPVVVLKYFAGKRAKAMSRQLSDALQIVVRSLEAGHPVPTAISLVAREMPDPVGGEFRIAADEMSYGVSLSTAIERLALRSGDPDVELFAATVRLQERTGGNLCDLLEASIDTIRDRQTLRLKVNAASSEGRASAMILTAAPFVVAGAIYLMKPDFYGSVIDDPTFQKILAGLGVWLAIGNLIMRRMINFRF